MQYNNEFDLLAFNGAKEKLHTNLGYPKEVLDFMYTPESFRRGLIIDKAEGNILKIDRHKYHRKVYHGSQELDKETRKNSKYSRHVYSYTESEYVVIDTLFLLVDAVLFASLVDFKDKHPETLKNKSYDQLYKDVRQSVDLCHRDGVIKDSVMKDPKKFIIHDPDVVPMLKRYRQEGKKVNILDCLTY